MGHVTCDWIADLKKMRHVICACGHAEYGMSPVCDAKCDCDVTVVRSNAVCDVTEYVCECDVTDVRSNSVCDANEYVIVM